jgi:N-acetylmuramoyl-L-alanine amidase
MTNYLKAILVSACVLGFGFTLKQQQQEEASQQQTPQLKTVVIDAGHGGKDTGCIGRISKEKNVVLDLALKLARKIKLEYPDVLVVLTRKSDKFVELNERANVANRRKADLFISIHCNSIPKGKTSPNGTETFVMGLHKSDENLEVAKRENAVILQEKNYEQNYKGFNLNSPLAYIMMANRQNAYLASSTNLASKIEKQFKNNSKRHSRGVKQAGFLVLWQSSMPSILIEAGFLSNREEEIYLNTEDGQNSIADSIFKAFSDYKNELEN